MGDDEVRRSPEAPAGSRASDHEGPVAGAREPAGWRPRSLRDGDEPDPRFTLANERTFLAWVRTSLGLVAGSVALETFAGDRIAPGVRTPLACVLLVLAALLAVAAFRRWLRIERAMRHSRPLPLPRVSVLLVVGIAVGATVLLVAIVEGARG